MKKEIILKVHGHIKKINTEMFMCLVGLIGPVMTLPQLKLIWINKEVAGVSIVMWYSYLLVAVIWLLYGLSRGIKPIIFINSIWIVVEFVLIIGISINN